MVDFNRESVIRGLPAQPKTGTDTSGQLAVEAFTAFRVVGLLAGSEADVADQIASMGINDADISEHDLREVDQGLTQFAARFDAPAEQHAAILAAGKLGTIGVAPTRGSGSYVSLLEVPGTHMVSLLSLRNMPGSLAKQLRVFVAAGLKVVASTGRKSKITADSDYYIYNANFYLKDDPTPEQAKSLLDGLLSAFPGWEWKPDKGPFSQTTTLRAVPKGEVEIKRLIATYAESIGRY